MQTTATPPQKTRLFALMSGLTLAVMSILTVMAGLPPAEHIGQFMFGVVVLLALTVTLGVFAWRLLLKPLPVGVMPTTPILIDATTRSVIALLLSLSALATGIATVWDEIWHTRYGIPFGEDFFWRPHLLMYFSFGTMVVLGGWSWWVLMHRAKGTLQQRFQANPLLGFSVFSGAFTLFAILADPIWHSFYGADISPWSLPHLFIVLLILVMGLQATAFHKSLMSAQTWRIGLNSFAWRNLLILLVLVGGVITFLLLFTVQWYTAAGADPAAMAVAASGADVTAIRAATSERSGAITLLLQVAAYPDWLFSVFLCFIATFFGALALHNTRQVGSATLVGVLSLVVRWAMENGFYSDSLGMTPLYLIIPVMVALDVVYALSLRRTGQPPAFWISGLVASVTLTGVSVVAMSALFPFMSSATGVIPARFIFSTIGAFGAIWLGQTISQLSGEATASSTIMTPQTRRVTAWVYSGFAAFLLWFVVTATPPA